MASSCNDIAKNRLTKIPLENTSRFLMPSGGTYLLQKEIVSSTPYDFSESYLIFDLSLFIVLKITLNMNKQQKHTHVNRN